MIAYGLVALLFLTACFGFGYCAVSLLDRAGDWNDRRRDRARRNRMLREFRAQLETHPQRWT